MPVRRRRFNCDPLAPVHFRHRCDLAMRLREADPPAAPPAPPAGPGIPAGNTDF